MAEKIVSPGVFTRENDLSFLPQGISQIGAAVVGPTEKGPAFLPTLIQTQAEYEAIFGTPKDYYTGYAVQNYLRDAGAVTVVRVAGVGGYSLEDAYEVIATTGSTSTTIAILAPATSSEDIAPLLQGGTNGTFRAVGTGLAAVSASIIKSDSNTIDDIFGESPFFGKKLYAYNFFDIREAGSSLSASFAGTGSSALTITFASASTQDFTGTAAAPAYNKANTPWVLSQTYSGTRYNLFKVHTLADGEGENTRFKVQISSIKSSDGTNYGTFSLLVRAYSDTDKRKTVLEQYNNLTLDPASPNFIARRIGDRTITIDENGKITENGNYSNRSKYVRIEVAEEGTYPLTAIPFAHAGYDVPFNVATPSRFPVVTYTSASFSSSVFSSGIDYAITNNKNYFKPLPANTTSGSNKVFALDSAAGALNEFNIGLSAAETSDSNQLAMRNFVVALQGGFAGQDPTVSIKKGVDISATNTQGFNCSSSTSSGSIAYAKALNAISNQDEFDINLLVTPGIVRQYHPYVTTKAIDVCEAREDVFYIADFAGADASIAEVVEQALGEDTNYAGTYYPWVKTIDVNTNKLVTVPPSVLMVGTFAQNDRLGAEWFAPAGLNRGGISGAVQVVNRLTQSERDTLYEGKVNPIATFPGQGISAFGQKTLQDKASALDRINVRRLLINLKKFVASTSRFLVFEQNTAQTRSKFLNTVNPYLESVQQRQGLYAFRVVMDETNNTPDVIDRNILAGAIFLQPSKTAEFITIDFNILPTGATFNV
jgi:hypothetical protein